MVAAVTYDEHSFWAGVAIGRRLKGYSAYGTMTGWDPEGDLIVRPVIQGVPAVKFGADRAFTITAMVDTVNEDATFPEQELPEISQEIGVIAFGRSAAFTILALNERLVIDEVITAYSIDKDINPLEYDDTIVFINSSGAFTMDTMTRTFTSQAVDIDIGTLQEVTVTTGEFAEVSTQEVTTA